MVNNLIDPISSRSILFIIRMNHSIDLLGSSRIPLILIFLEYS